MAEPTMSSSSDQGASPSQPDAAPADVDREVPMVAADTADGATPPAASNQADGDAREPASDTTSDASEGAVTEDVVKLALRRVKDPELNLNILDLGLIYGIRVEGSAVTVDMTLTSPGCPSGPEIMTDAERHLRALPGVTDVTMNLVWSPFWSPDRIEPRVRAYLGF